MVDPTGLRCRLGSRSARPGDCVSNLGLFLGLVAACSEVFLVRYWCSDRHRRRLTQHITATPHSLDVVTAAGCSGKFFAQAANKNVNDFRLRLVHPTVNVTEKHPPRQNASFTQAEQLEDAILLRGQAYWSVVH